MTALGPRYARTAAKEAWGNVNSCKQVVPGVWAVDTWGHGGYIVAVGPNEPFQLHPALAQDRFLTTRWTQGGVPVVTFYEFEEDCAWSLLGYFHPEVLAAELGKGLISAEYANADYVREVVGRYYPEFLEPVAL